MASLFSKNLLSYLFDAIKSRGRNFAFDRLEREDFKKISSDRKLKRFIEKAKIEDIIYLMSRLGFGYVQLFWDKEKHTKKSIKDLLIREISANGVNISEFIIKEKVFSNTDIDVVKSMQLLSNVGSSKVYSINKKFLELDKKRSYKASLDIENKERVAETLKWCSGVTRSILTLGSLLEDYKISKDAFLILCLLQENQNGASLKYISTTLNISDRKARFLIKKLFFQNMVDTSIGDYNSYVLDTMGYVCVERIFSKIF